MRACLQVIWARAGSRFVGHVAINNGKEDCQDGSDENHTILNYTNQTSIGNLIWLCDGKLLNISDLCNGRGMSTIVFIEKIGLFVGNNF